MSIQIKVFCISLPGRGLPIGNLASQYFANHYLAVADHYIKEQLRCRRYVRYMDDLVLWHKDKECLIQGYHRLVRFVGDKLQLTWKTPLINRPSRGLPFCGYILFPHHIRLSQRSKRRFIAKINKLEGECRSGQKSEAACQRQALSLIGFTSHCDSRQFRQAVMSRLNSEVPYALG